MRLTNIALSIAVKALNFAGAKYDITAGAERRWSARADGTSILPLAAPKPAVLPAPRPTSPKTKTRAAKEAGAASPNYGLYADHFRKNGIDSLRIGVLLKVPFLRGVSNAKLRQRLYTYCQRKWGPQSVALSTMLDGIDVLRLR